MVAVYAEGTITMRGFHPYRYMANHARLFNSVRSDPRFAAHVAEAKRRWEAFTP
jgi:hypothetical protein